MVLLAGPGPEGGGARRVSPQSPSPPRDAQAGEDPADFEEYEDFSSLPDTRSIASDDSFYPFGGEEEYSSVSAESVPEAVPEAATLLRAACANDVGLLRALVRRGPSAEEVQETDRNGRTGLIVACYHGFVDTVVVLADCPHVDVNWQDSEGNTALITAAQAGHVTITNYLLNYFPGLDLERRNVFGFTALMKAAMQGRTECIRALMLAGADVHARDPHRGMSSQEWATYTGRFEAVHVIQRLLERPCPEQFGEKYKPELPLAPEAGPKPAGSKNCLQRLTAFVRSMLTSRLRQGLEDGGVLDHMVKMTTSLYSPAVAVVCQTMCPENPPCVGKRRLAVQEILAARGQPDTQAQERDKAQGAEQRFRTSQTAGVSREGAPRASSTSSSQLPAAPRKASLLSLQLLRRSSVRPGVVIPKVRISKAPAPAFQPERAAKGSTKDSTHLQLPKWRYKEAKEERRKAEEAEKQRLATAHKEKRAPSWRKRT
ncbi:ankyrin repeat domain-containing protein 33B [Lagenorhynchus albirostris]|uniref:ankyrin repeat domain-containing protein 33B n=1 Tax=Lagenorhynchus albirostris TaxID=27610 RepID=UPI0028E397C2|nr:ankyrin repeat domain-containing protein 33B [Lagenorhynchus albirostris]XP_060002855.1 ankyrin repeat domain-containing protein 33B [Lagenorhynchus albirostris]